MDLLSYSDVIILNINGAHVWLDRPDKIRVLLDIIGPGDKDMIAIWEYKDNLKNGFNKKFKRINNDSSAVHCFLTNFLKDLYDNRDTIHKNINPEKLSSKGNYYYHRIRHDKRGRFTVHILLINYKNKIYVFFTDEEGLNEKCFKNEK